MCSLHSNISIKLFSFSILTILVTTLSTRQHYQWFYGIGGMWPSFVGFLWTGRIRGELRWIVELTRKETISGVICDRPTVSLYTVIYVQASVRSWRWHLHDIPHVINRCFVHRALTSALLRVAREFNLSASRIINFGNFGRGETLNNRNWFD